MNFSDSFCVSLIKIQAVNLTVANFTLRNLTIYSNYSVISAESVNTTLVNITFINITDFQIINITANLFIKNNLLGFLDFNRPVVRVYIKRTIVINVLGVYLKPFYGSCVAMIYNSKDLIFVDSLMTKNYTGNGKSHLNFQYSLTILSCCSNALQLQNCFQKYDQ